MARSKSFLHVGAMVLLPLTLAFAPAPAPAVTVIGGSPDRVATLQRVLEDFDDAGLELPPLVVLFHDDRGPCLGPNGLYEWPRGERPHVHVCAQDVGEHRFVRHTIAHELAHVWADQHLDGGQKQRFLEHRGLSEWTGAGVGWAHKGSEHAAEIVGSAAVGDPVYKGLPDRSCTRLRSAYETLTGEPPGNPLDCGHQTR